MSYNLARSYSRSFKGPIDESLVFNTSAERTQWLQTPQGIAIAYTGMIVSDIETNKAYILNSSNTWQELASSQLATSSISGLVKLFSDTTQTQAAQTVSSTANRTYGMQLNSADQLVVNIPWTDTVYSHPSYTALSTTTTAGSVISAIYSNSLGHITGVNTRNLNNSDVGLGNVTNNAQIIATVGRTDGYIPTWSNNDGTTLGNGYGVTTAISSETATNSILATSNAIKTYVDNTIANNQQGLDIKASVRFASTQSDDYDAEFGVEQLENVLTSNNVGVFSIDGRTPVVGDRILLKNQFVSHGPHQNGIYNVLNLGGPASFFKLERSTDANNNDKVNAGMFVFVTEGATNADTGWVAISDDPILLNENNLNFSQFSAAGQIYDGSGLYKQANTIGVGQGDGITVGENGVAVNAGSGLTVDANGVHIGVNGGLTLNNDSISVDSTVVRTTSYTNGQLLIGNDTGNTLTKSTLTQGTAISITNGNGSITVTHGNTSNLTGTQASVGVANITVDEFGHVTSVTEATYVTSADLCTSISSCPIDGGTF